MNQYSELLQNILWDGDWKEAAREGMPRTKSIIGPQMRFKMRNGFPLVTTKKMFTKGILVELLWFLRGDTNIKYLVDNGCNIWNDDAYRHYKNFVNKTNVLDFDLMDSGPKPFSKEDFIQKIKDGELGQNPEYLLGDLGPVYGAQWRRWPQYDSKGNVSFVDQIADVLKGLRENPTGRRHIVSAWNPADIPSMALPPCHCLFQFFVRHVDGEDVLDLLLYQRSCDTFLGVPFNIASYAYILHIFAKMSGLVPGEFIWTGGDTHLYEDHIPMAEEQIKRKPYTLPKLVINDRVGELQDPMQLELSDFQIVNYNSHPKIEAKLSVGT